MREVMQKAQELGLAILDSETFKASKEAEEKMMADPEASRLLSAYIEQQNNVNALMANEDLDPVTLSEAGKALQAAQDALHANELVKAAQEANAAANAMIDNVNRLIQLIVSGNTGEGGCTGSCETCGGCH